MNTRALAGALAVISSALTDWRWSNGLTDALPPRYERNIISKYTSKYKNDSVAANVWLRRIMQKIHRVKMPLTAIASDSSAELWAAEYFRLRYTNAKNNIVVIDELIARYKHLRDYAKKAGFSAPGEGRKTMTAEQVSQAVFKLDSERWWKRQAKTTAARCREYIAIALGMVTKNAEPYVSRECLLEYRKQQENAALFLQENWIGIETETDSGFIDMEAITLAEASAKSTANPEIRRLEMMARIRGIEEAAKAEGLEAVFLTWTAPGAYHYNSGKKWNGADPRDTQQYLSKQWAKARAELKEAGIPFSGLRVVEPHNDETPHWHLLIFVSGHQKAAFLAICEFYALQHDKDEKGALQHRFLVEEIDPAKGSAVGYIAKYISKSINGAKVEDLKDDDTGEPLTDTAEKCRAWASRWGIRQFQFVGAPSVSIWRELRRIKEPLTCEKTEAIRNAADNGRFCEFIQLMGGLGAARKDYPVNTMKRERVSNDGVVRHSIGGIITAMGEWMITRKNWISLGRIANSFARFELLQGASRAARTRENNCKSPEKLAELAEIGNEKLSLWQRTRRAVVGYINAAGDYITEFLTDYEGEQWQEV